METLKELLFKAHKAGFEKLEKIVDISSLSKEEREKYDESIKVYRDTLATLSYAEQKGRAEGREEGRAEGREEGILDVARKMKSSGLDIDTICRFTGLTHEKVQSLSIFPTQ